MMSGEPTTLARLLRARMDDLGITSVRGLARRAGIGNETARRLFTPGRQPAETTLQRLADNLEGLSLTDLRRVTGRPTGGYGPFVLPAEADQLDPHQRHVVLAMVRALLHTHTTSPVRVSGEGDVTLRAVPRLAARPRGPDGAPPTGEDHHPQ